MAAFNPFALLPALMPATDTVATMQRAQSVHAAEAREAETRAATAQALAAQEAEAALAEDDRRADIAAAEQAIGADLDQSRTAREGDLAAALAQERVRQAAAGVSGGRTGRLLLEGLKQAASADGAAEQEAARLRLADIRRETDSARRKDLLALADSRRRAELARSAAATDTALARRSASLAAASDRLGAAQATGAGGLADVLYGAAGQLIRRW